MQTTIQRVQLPDNRRILMISDIHGHAEGLRAVLKEAHFGEQDILILVGDYLEKGPQNLQTLRDVMALCSHFTVYPVMGNVDLWRLECLMSDDPEVQQEMVRYSRKARTWWSSSVLGELLAELGLSLDEDLDLASVFPHLREHFAPELAFLQSLPIILETQNMIFVHGGIPHENLDELMDENPHSLMKRDHFMEEGLSFSKYVVVGHWPVALYSQFFSCSNPVINRDRHIISLDGGCGVKEDGQLNLLTLPDWRSEDFTLYTWNPLPRLTALDAQPESPSHGYIRWGDHHVDVLEQTGDWSRIRHHGHELTVPAAFLWTDDHGASCCSDISDYQLAVSPGDSLSLIHATEQGCYVKKGGVSGWYSGRFKQELPKA